jgi:hypothetical protein
MNKLFATILISILSVAVSENIVLAQKPTVSCFSIDADWLPKESYYITIDSNIYELNKVANGDWIAGWGVFETSRARGGQVLYKITWENGSDELGSFAGNQYQIEKHSGDRDQVGKRITMEPAKIPKDAVAALDVARKRSFPLELSTQKLANANNQLNQLDSGLSNRQVKQIGLPYSSGHANDSRGILKRLASVREKADALNALEIMRDFNR